MPKFYSGDLYSAVLSKLDQAANYSKVRIKAGLDAHEQARGMVIMFTHHEVVALEEVLGWNYQERIRLRGKIAELKAELAEARDQFMREREHWLALRDENAKLNGEISRLKGKLIVARDRLQQKYANACADYCYHRNRLRGALQQIELLNLDGDCCKAYNVLMQAKAIARNTLAAEKQERDDVDQNVSARSDG
jgi:predicted nuclease with TOPRIM domain